MNGMLIGLRDLKLVLAGSAANLPEKANALVGGVSLGKDFLLIGGPCSVESEEQIIEVAKAVKLAGANILRGGAYKPRTSPYSFPGLGRTGLEYLRKAGEAAGLPVITEVVDTRDVPMICEYADIIQIGSRNMQNYALLVELGKTSKPALLKRGVNATIEEWLCSAEYIMGEGNHNVILCERGIRSFDAFTRNMLDLGAVAAVKKLTHLPVIVDPSHATGRADLIRPMSLSAIMAGCDGLAIEVHPNPPQALSDGSQQLTPEEFSQLADEIRATLSFRKEL
jgi:3-deoxy-7-phosphoheptulonate synthase